MYYRILLVLFLVAACAEEQDPEISSERALPDKVESNQKELGSIGSGMNIHKLSERDFYTSNFLDRAEKIKQYQLVDRTRKDHTEVLNLLLDEGAAFSLQVPAGVEAQFGTGFATAQGASLLNFCQGLEYSKNIPSMRDFFNMSKDQGVCGATSLRLCLRLNLTAERSHHSYSQNIQYEYLDLPRTEIHLPCKTDSFSKIGVSVGKAINKDAVLPLTISVGSAVHQVLYENNSECSDRASSVDINEQELVDLPVIWYSVDGQKNFTDVSLKFLDIYGFESACISNKLFEEDYVSSNEGVDDTSTTTETNDIVEEEFPPPSSPAFLIENGADYTNQSQLNISFTETPKQLVEFSISESGSCDSEVWHSYTNAHLFSISGENATVVVSVKFRNSGGVESDCITKSIIHDSLAPGSPSVIINSGDLVTVSNVVELSLSASDAESMYITNAPSCVDDGQWESFSSKKYWVISNQNPHEVYVRFRDQVGNISPCVRSSIIHLGWEDTYDIETISEDAASSVDIATDEEGSVLAIWSQDYNSKRNLMVRKYENSTWGKISIISLENGTGMGSSQVVAGSNPGDYHVAWIESVDGVSKLRFRSLINSNWTDTFTFDHNGQYVQDFEIISGEAGKVWMVWSTSETLPNYTTQNRLHRRFFDGTSWQDASEIQSTIGGGGSPIFDATVDLEGRLHVINCYRSIFDISVYSFDGDDVFVSSTASGLQPAIGDRVKYATIAVDENGNLVATWLQNGADVFKDDIWTRKFNGGTWEAPELVENRSGNAAYFQLAENSGHIFSIWRQDDGDSNKDIWMSRYSDNSWSDPVILVENSDNSSPGELSVHRSGSALHMRLKSVDSQNVLVSRYFDGSVWGEESTIYSTDFSYSHFGLLQYSDLGQKIYTWRSFLNSDSNIMIRTYD